MPREAASLSFRNPFFADLERLRAATAGDPEICIAIIDGPADLAHPSFRGAGISRVPTLAPQGSGSGEASRHGTHIASLIFGQPGSPVRGVAPGCRGFLLPVFRDGRGDALAPCSQIDLARAITQAVELGAAVINISGGEPAPGGEAHRLLVNALRLAEEAGALVVAAAGNDGCECLHVPAALASVLAVGAMDHDGEPLPFSNRGAAYRGHGVLAPGRDVLGAVPGGGAVRRTGTSYAAALVSGVAALLLSLQRRQGRRPDSQTVRNAILGSATGRDRWVMGRLDIAGAASLLTTGGNMEIDETVEYPLLPDLGGPPAPRGFARRIVPSDCGCGCGCGGGGACGGAKGPALVYALGQLGHDFGSEARRDSFVQLGIANPDDPRQLLKHLDDHPAHAPSVIWTLSQEATPIYAIEPEGPFAAEVYASLRKLLESQLAEGAEQISIPGRVSGHADLRNGQAVPVIHPEIRGLYSWSTAALVDAVLGGEASEARDRRAEDISNFLERVNYEVRNLGLSPQERAINFAATNAFQVERVFQAAIEAELRLESIAVERSPLCRPESDCWDVRLTFFNPLRRQEQAREVYRFTVDVSDVVPVSVGKVRRWHLY